MENNFTTKQRLWTEVKMLIPLLRCYSQSLITDKVNFYTNILNSNGCSWDLESKETKYYKEKIRDCLLGYGRDVLYLTVLKDIGRDYLSLNFYTRTYKDSFLHSFELHKFFSTNFLLNNFVDNIQTYDIDYLLFSLDVLDKEMDDLILKCSN